MEWLYLIQVPRECTGHDLSGPKENTSLKKNLQGTLSVDERETHYETCTKEFTGHNLSGP